MTRLALVTVLAVSLTACADPTPIEPTGTRTFHDQNIAFTYPAAWREFPHSIVSSFSSSIVELATVDVPDACISRLVNGGTETVCADRFRLEPNTLVVAISANGFPGFDIVTSRPPGAVPLIVGGQPAFAEHGPPEDPATGADEVLTWTIARPVKWNSFVIRASLRGPDLAALEDQLKALVATVRLDGS